MSRQELGRPLTKEFMLELQEAIRAKGWDYSVLAKRAGVSSRTIQSWFDRSAQQRAAEGNALRPRCLQYALTALGIDERLTRRIGMEPRRTDGVDVFLASAMEAAGDDYKDLNWEVMEVVNSLRGELGLSVFYAGEDRPESPDFEDEA